MRIDRVVVNSSPLINIGHTACSVAEGDRQLPSGKDTERAHPPRRRGNYSRGLIGFGSCLAQFRGLTPITFVSARRHYGTSGRGENFDPSLASNFSLLITKRS